MGVGLYMLLSGLKKLEGQSRREAGESSKRNMTLKAKKEKNH